MRIADWVLNIDLGVRHEFRGEYSEWWQYLTSVHEYGPNIPFKITNLSNLEFRLQQARRLEMMYATARDHQLEHDTKTLDIGSQQNYVIEPRLRWPCSMTDKVIWVHRLNSHRLQASITRLDKIKVKHDRSTLRSLSNLAELIPQVDTDREQILLDKYWLGYPRCRISHLSQRYCEALGKNLVLLGNAMRDNCDVFVEVGAWFIQFRMEEEPYSNKITVQYKAKPLMVSTQQEFENAFCWG